MRNVIYTFNGKDITMNMCIQIRAVANVLMERLHISFEEALMLFYHSETYKTLQNTENTFWAESAEFIVDRYFEECDQKYEKLKKSREHAAQGMFRDADEVSHDMRAKYGL